MKCYIITKADLGRFKCRPIVAKYGWRPTYVCHTNEQADVLVSAGVQRKNVRVSGAPCTIQGVSLQREYVAQHLMPQGEWCLWLDDNVYSVTGLRPALAEKHPKSLSWDDGTNWRHEFAHELEPNELGWHVRETLNRAEACGTIFAAFANEENILFRRNHWQSHGYCRTRFALYRNDGSTWVPFDTMMLEDMAKSIDVVCRYGQIVINRYVRCLKEMFEPGGIGTFNERLPWLRDNCQKLMAMYPGLVKTQRQLTAQDFELIRQDLAAGESVGRVAKKYGVSGTKINRIKERPDDSKHRIGTQYGTGETEFHLKWARYGQASIDRWRKEHGYL